MSSEGRILSRRPLLAAPAALLALAVLLVACTVGADERSPPPSAATASPAAITVPGPDGVGAVAAAPAVTVDGVSTARPSGGGEPQLLAVWAAVTDQRRDVLELGLTDVVRMLRGEFTDWSEVGGSPAAVVPYVPAGDEWGIAAALGIGRDEIRARVEPLATLPALVAGTPGAFALLPPQALRPGLLALVVDGHDPYRDPDRDSPLRLERRASPAAGVADPPQAAALLAFQPIVPSDPLGMLMTGELIPARCTNAALEVIGAIGATFDFGPMFDGTEALLRRADVTVMPLEVALTDLGPPTPCTNTFQLQGRPEAADAAAAAGVDVMVTAGNHIMDCWSGCSPGAALAATLEHLDRAGLAHTGAGADLASARTPVIIERDGVRLAVLGYDSIGTHYFATPVSPGTAPLDLVALAEDVRAAKQRADHVIVAIGWGVEYTADPTAIQREAAAVAIDAGASLVVGHHPHWAQAVELFDGAVVAYALGNFVFDQDWSEPTMQGLVIEAGFTADRLLGFRLRPVVIRGLAGAVRGLFRPEFVDPAGEGQPTMRRVWDASDRLPERPAAP